MMLSYSLISSLILGLGYIVYRLTMSGTRQHSLNRLCLLMLYGVSLVLPLIILAILLQHPEHTADLGIEIGALNGTMHIEEATAPTIPTEDAVKSIGMTISISEIIRWTSLVYSVGALMCAVYFAFGILMLGWVIRKGERMEFGTFSLILVDNNCPTSPFSWGRSIVMTRNDYAEDGDMILLHEHAHLRHSHWTDLMLAYSTICLQWYNPAAWAMREELKAVHEYQADESVLATGTDAKEYQMMLLKKAAGNGYQSLANSLNHSKLQKRITMMYKKKTSVGRRLFALALIPAIGSGIALTSIPSVAGVLQSIAESTETKPVETLVEVPQITTPSDRVVFTATETMAEFPGGMKALMEWLHKQIKYPEQAEKENVQGRVIVKFVIESDGSVTDPQVIKGVSRELDKEAIRVIKAMPKWTPGKVNGKDVASYFTIPVNFSLKDDKKENSTPAETRPSIPIHESADAASQDKTIYVAVEEQAEFPGGMKALMEWLSDQIKYPENAEKEGVQGRVIAKLVIEPDGSVGDIKVVKGVSPDLDAEAVRVLSAMPKWSPGKVNGKAIASYFTLPVNFRLKVDKKEELTQAN